MSRHLLTLLALAHVACSSPGKPATSPPPSIVEARDASIADAAEPYELVATPDGHVIRRRIVDAGVPAAEPFIDGGIRVGKQGDVCDGPNPAYCGPNLRCCYPCGTGGCRRICQPQCLPVP
jgi:hypothetical protein